MTKLNKTLAAFSAAALLTASANAIVIDISSAGDSGLAFGGDSSVSFFSNVDGHVFEVNDSDGAVGDAKGLFGSIGGIWTIDPWTGNTTTLSGGPGTFTIWDENSETLTADLDLSMIGTVLSGGVMNGASNLSNFAYAGTNEDLMWLASSGVATLSLSFELAQGPSDLSIDYLAENSIESTFSGDVAATHTVPEGGTTAALMGFGLFAIAAYSRKRSFRSKRAS
ncbi:hypothetical protein QEH56_11450 [Pelagicoccus enzymogenes]|uniref:hypothetical protein n=1 Tax=Pelagicoccus enzymogenes TaxID=2773457 RepID=UPI00280DBE89|nr:hypothetical protein [Pelagicoccus enzymogenes]MDQ8198770.1 hypothetical protein [Pelagicoccus enzymogenes]